MAKNKHNKKRNTAFLYEVLVREIAAAILKKDLARRSKLTSLLKHSFCNDSLLQKELRLYQELYESVCDTSEIAEKILSEVKSQHGLLDKEELKKQQENLARKLKKISGAGVWNTFVPNYTTLASISQIFSSAATPKGKVLLENKVVEQMSRPLNEKGELAPIDKLVMRQFVNKFNETYSSLHEEQVKLLQKFVLSFGDNSMDLRLFLNEEVRRLKEKMNLVLDAKEVKSDKFMLEKAEKVRGLLEDFKNSKPDKEMVSKVLKIQELVREVE